jgi:hypothetical protein
MRHRTSAEWVAYFEENERPGGRLAWPRDAGVSREEIEAILPSIQAWQLCGQMPRDEMSRAPSQCERLNTAQGERPAWRRVLVDAAGRLLFLSFWSESWRRLRRVWQKTYAEVPTRRTTKTTAPPIRRRAADGVIEAPSRTRGWLH